jgi:hypothetical protein
MPAKGASATGGDVVEAVFIGKITLYAALCSQLGSLLAFIFSDSN